MVERERKEDRVQGSTSGAIREDGSRREGRDGVVRKDGRDGPVPGTRLRTGGAHAPSEPGEGAIRQEPPGQAVRGEALHEADGEALEDLFRKYHRLVFDAAYRITGNASDAEDVLQTVFLRLARRRDGAPPDLARATSSYLHVAATNAAIDIMRSRAAWRSAPIEEAEPSLRQDGQAEVDRRLRSFELRAVLRRALGLLDPQGATIFALRYFEGRDNRSIARMVGRSPVYVAVVLHRARRRLTKEIREHLEAGHDVP